MLFDLTGVLKDQLEFQCRHACLQGIFLMPSCCNPTTVVMSEQRRHEIADLIQKYHLILIEDDIYAFLLEGKSCYMPITMRVPDQSVWICGTSKPICFGLRVAYLVFPSKFRESVERGIYNINVKTSSLDAEIITQLIQEANTIFSSYFSECTTGNRNSFYRWLPIYTKESGRETENRLLQKGLRIYHSDRFPVGTGIGNSFKGD